MTLLIQPRARLAVLVGLTILLAVLVWWAFGPGIAHPSLMAPFRWPGDGGPPMG